MFVLIRTIMYVVLIGGLVALFLPAPFPSGWGLTRPEAMHVPQLVGMVLGVGGAALALLCVVAFAVVGTGTPLPFDPPRRSVVGGPYRYVRNPMAVGVSLALVGAATFYQSVALFGFTGLFVLVIHAMVVWYEVPTRRRMFGGEYETSSRGRSLPSHGVWQDAQVAPATVTRSNRVRP